MNSMRIIVINIFYMTWHWKQVSKRVYLNLTYKELWRSCQFVKCCDFISFTFIHLFISFFFSFLFLLTSLSCTAKLFCEYLWHQVSVKPKLFTITEYKLQKWFFKYLLFCTESQIYICSIHLFSLIYHSVVFNYTLIECKTNVKCE